MPDPVKILFVDDEPDLAPLIRQKFRRHVREGLFDLVFAGDGVEALAALDDDPAIEIVVTDLNMPRMDGLTLLGELGARERIHKAIVVTAYGDMENIRTAMNRGAFDFLTKPIDLSDLETTISNARAIVEREREAERVRRTFGRYLSDEVATALLSAPDANDADKRVVTVLMSDLTGFSMLSEGLEPERVVELLNVYLARMTEVIDEFGGTIDEFIGDAILVIFGAPIEREDHAERAVACAIAMQNAMADVNAELARRGLPGVEMGIAINTGEVVVGSIGSDKRAKYAVVGSPVNLTSRIGTLAAGGEVLLSPTTYERLGERVRLSATREVALKGFPDPVAIYCVDALEGPYAATLVPTDGGPLVALPAPVPFVYVHLDGKRLADETLRGEILRLSGTHAAVRTAQPLEDRTDLRLTLGADHPDGELIGDLYAKVVEVEGDGVVLRFTAVPREVAEALARLRGEEPAAAPQPAAPPHPGAEPSAAGEPVAGEPVAEEPIGADVGETGAPAASLSPDRDAAA